MKRKNVKAMAMILTAAVVGIGAIAGVAKLAAFETKEVNTQEQKNKSVLAVDSQNEADSYQTCAGIAKYIGDLDQTRNGKNAVAEVVAQAADAQSHPVEVLKAQKQEQEAQERILRQEAIAQWENRAIASNVSEYVYMREEASMDSEIVGKLPKGGAGDVLAHGEAFTYISSGEVTGYVSNDYLATGEEALQVAEAVCDVVAVADADLISVRQSPSMEAEILQVANEGDTFQVVEETMDWVKVSTDQITGYMSKEVVLVDFDTKEAEAIQQPTPAPTKTPAKEETKKETSKPAATTVPTKTPAKETTESIPASGSGQNSRQFKVTAYCPCTKCCGGHANGITATGTTCTEGRTIAVDPSVIPLGTTVYINGQPYVAEDTGVKGNKIDLYMNSHEAALQWGVRYVTVTW